MKTLIKNGRVIDPANWIDAEMNLLLEDGHVCLATAEQPTADRVIDAAGCVVCPGWIDIHMHEDPVGTDGHIRYDIFNQMLRMGVTTAVGGNCGSNECDPSEYLDIVDRDGAPVNLVMLAGHSYFRRKAGVQNKYAPATEEQKQRMTQALKDALEHGCAGISFGLRYVPGTDQDEFLRAAECLQGTGKLMTAHVRDDADRIFSAISQIADAGVRFGVPVQISHIGSMAGFGQMRDVLRMTDMYRANGLKIALDCYPYHAFSTELGATTYDDGWLERYHCDYNVLEYCEGPLKGKRADAESFKELRRTMPDMLTVCHVMKQEEIDFAYQHPSVMVASDGIMNNGQGHPRAAGTFPRVFAEYVRTGKLSLFDAIAKMTSIPAACLGIKKKGSLGVGSDADVVIFRPDIIADKATFAEPTLAPVGIEYVLINGQIAVEKGKMNPEHFGRAVRIMSRG